MIQVVAVDLDGTLLRTDGTVSARTRRAVRACADQGITVLPVTARSPAEAAQVAALIGAGGAASTAGDAIGGPVAIGDAICCLGAVVGDFAAGTVRRAWPFRAGTAAELVARVRAVVPTAAFGWVDPHGAGREPDYPRRPDRTGFRVAPFAPAPGGEVWHLFARDAGRGPLPMARLRAVVAGLAETGEYDNDPGLLELTPPGVDKGSGLRRWCADRGIPAQRVAAVGDTLADLPMLTWAGVGAAVGNAPPRVRAAVGHVLPENDADGVALLLERAAAGTLRRRPAPLPGVGDPDGGPGPVVGTAPGPDQRP